MTTRSRGSRERSRRPASPDPSGHLGGSMALGADHGSANVRGVAPPAQGLIMWSAPERPEQVERR